MTELILKLNSDDVLLSFPHIICIINFGGTYPKNTFTMPTLYLPRILSICHSQSIRRACFPVTKTNELPTKFFPENKGGSKRVHMEMGCIYIAYNDYILNCIFYFSFITNACKFNWIYVSYKITKDLRNAFWKFV